MERMKKDAQDGGGQKGSGDKTRVEVHAAPMEPPAPMGPPGADMETPPTLGEIERRTEVEKLGEVGRLPESSPTQQLARWLQRLGHLCQVGRSQPEGSSN